MEASRSTSRKASKKLSLRKSKASQILRGLKVTRNEKTYAKKALASAKRK